MFNSVPRNAIVIQDYNNAVNKVLKLLKGHDYRLRYLPTKVELIYKYDSEISQVLKEHGIKYTRLFSA